MDHNDRFGGIRRRLRTLTPFSSAENDGALACGAASDTGAHSESKGLSPTASAFEYRREVDGLPRRSPFPAPRAVSRSRDSQIGASKGAGPGPFGPAPAAGLGAFSRVGYTARGDRRRERGAAAGRRSGRARNAAQPVLRSPRSRQFERACTCPGSIRTCETGPGRSWGLSPDVLTRTTVGDVDSMLSVLASAGARRAVPRPGVRMRIAIYGPWIPHVSAVGTRMRREAQPVLHLVGLPEVDPAVRPRGAASAAAEALRAGRDR